MILAYWPWRIITIKISIYFLLFSIQLICSERVQNCRAHANNILKLIKNSLIGCFDPTLTSRIIILLALPITDKALHFCLREHLW